MKKGCSSSTGSLTPNRGVIQGFRRYQELLVLREQGIGAFDNDDFRDLQLLFNLAWTDPDFLAESPLTELVTKGRTSQKRTRRP